MTTTPPEAPVDLGAAEFSGFPLPGDEEVIPAEREIGHAGSPVTEARVAGGNRDYSDDYAARVPGDVYVERVPATALTVDESGTSDLEAMAAELAEKVEVEDVLVPVPLRPGYQLRCTPDLSGPRLAGLRKEAADRRSPDGIDNTKLGILILLRQCTGIVREGVLVKAGGQPLLPSQPGFTRMLKTGSALQAMRDFYGKDGHLDAAAREVLAASGWGDDLTSVSAADPTRGAGH